MKLEREALELRRLWSGFWGARVVITANNLGIFEHLRTARSAAETAGLIKGSPRGTEILLDALTGLGLLKKGAGRYRNSAAATRFLVRQSPHYQGDIIRHADTLWQNWSYLDEAVLTGAPVRKAQDHEAFIRGMHDIAILRAKRVVRELSPRGTGSALDLGGGPGTYSMELARAGMRVTLFDLPDTIQIARRITSEAGFDSIEFLAGDFFSDDMGRGYDLILISQVLHSFSADDNLILLRRCREALQPGGRVVIHEFLIDDGLTSPPNSALFSVNMLVNTGGGRCYAAEEMMGWLARSGFRKCRKKLLEDTVLLFATL